MQVSRKWLALAAACVGLSMLMVDLFVVNVALPAIGRDFGADLAAVEWTVTGYVLMMGVLPLAAGRLGDLFGRRRVYLVGLVLFVVASAGCALAGDVLELALMRVVQGVGAAVMTPATLAIVTRAFPPQERGVAIGVWSGVSALGLIAGPVLGGLLVQGDGWRTVFLINLPIGVVAVAMALAFVPESRDEDAPRAVDWPGIALVTAGLTALMLGLTEAGASGWGSVQTLGRFGLGALLLAGLVAVERRAAAPLVDLGLFRERTFVAACVGQLLFAAAVFGSQPFVSLFMQNYWGFTPLQGGLGFLPATLFVALLMPVSGALGQRLGPRLRLVGVGGALAVAAGFAALGGMGVDSTYFGSFLVPFVVRGMGIGLVAPALSLAAVSALPDGKAGLASGTLTMARNVGTALGVALLGTVYTAHVERDLPPRLAGQPQAEVAASVAAATHFLPTGADTARAAAQAAIVGGFVETALAGALLCALATVAMLFIRHRVSERAGAAAPAEPVVGRVVAEAA